MNKSVVEGRLYYCTSVGGFAQRVVPIGAQSRGQPRKSSRSLMVLLNALFSRQRPAKKLASGVTSKWCVDHMRKSV